MKLAISIGDVAGIGPEVLLKALREPLDEDVGIVVYGDYEVLRRENDYLGDAGFDDQEFDQRFVAMRSADESLEAGCVGVVDVAPEVDMTDVDKGDGDARCAEMQRAAFERAIDAVVDEDAQAVVTAPWNKSLFERIGEPVVGHTEVLQDRFQTSSPVMMLAGPRLRVSLVTTHIPLRRVADRVTHSRLREVVRTTLGGLRRRFGIDQPEVAVCGLNPHSGEGGAMGDEELDILEPALENLRAETERSVQIDGPLSPDSLFAKYRNGDAPYDAVVCMYHDQGLIPLKLLHFGQSANVTLGLPVIRTSVDHGTAYDIAGEGVADPGSMRYAIEVAVEMIRRDG